MAPVVVPGVNIPLLTGPLVLGYMLSYLFYGILIVQVYMYCELFPRERRAIKAVVFVMFTLETIFTFFTAIAAWNQYGPGWGDIDSILFIDWSWDPLPALNGTLAAIAQGFYIWRIWTLTKSIWMPIVIGFMAMSFYYGIATAVAGGSVEVLFSLSVEITLWLVGSAVADFLITVSLVWIFLSRKKTATEFERTSGVISKLIRFSVETGSVTSLVAITELVLWLTSGHKWNIHFIFFLLLGKLYSNMLVATLNSRTRVFTGDRLASTGGGAPAASVSVLWPDIATAAPQLSSGFLQRSGMSRVTHEEVIIDPDRDIVVMDNLGRESWDDRVYDLKPPRLRP
ncbi:hypothetical protein C8R46DRAFT_1207231 [Mycena filopes]|nr:hypothetical protein C8R46DRAFT_1207231 [Mycena filopes]